MARGDIRLATLFYELEARSSGLDRDLRESQRIMGRFSNFVRNNPAAAVGALGTALAGIGIAAVRAARQLETGFAEVSTLVDTAAVDMGRLRDETLELAKSIPVADLNDLTRGLYQVISAGVPASEAVEFLGTAARAAVGGVTDVTTAVDGLTTAVNAYSATGLTAAEASDQFFTAIRLGKTTFAELSTGIGQAAPLAAALNVNLADLLANVTALSLSGISTSQAFAAIRQALANVLRPTAEFRQQFPALAKEFNRTRLESQGLTAFLVDLAKATETNRDAVIRMFGSQESLNAVFALTANGGARVQAILGEIAESGGAAAEAFDKIDATSTAASQKLQNTLRVELANLGFRLLPYVNDGLRTLIDLLERFGSDATRQRGAQAAVGRVREVASELEKLNPFQYDALQDDATKVAEAISKGILDPATLAIRDLEALSKGIQKVGETLAQQQGPISFFDGLRFRHLSRALDQVRTALDQARELQHALDNAAASGPFGGGSTARPNDRLAQALGVPTPPPEPLGPVPVPEAGTTPTPGPTAEELAAQQRERERQAEIARRARETLEDLRVEIATALANATGIVAQQEVARFDRLVEDLKRRIAELPASAQAEARRLADQLLAATQQGFSASARTAILKRDDPDGFAAALERARSVLGEMQPELSATTEATIAQALFRERATEALERDRRTVRQIRTEEERRVRTLEEQLRAAQAQAFVLQSAARGALDLADAFGLMDENLRRSLDSIIQIGTGIDPLIKAIRLGSTGGIVTAALPVLGGLASLVSGLFGPDPEEERRRKVLEENSRRIQELTQTIGELGSVLGDVPGRTIADVSQAISATLSGGTGVFEVAEVLERELGRLGLTMSDLRTVAAGLGIELIETLGGLRTSIRQLQDAINAAEIARFATTFTGQLQALRLEFELFDLTDPIQQLQRLAGLAAGDLGSAALFGPLQDLDLTTAAGRAAADAILQDLFRQLQTGGLDESQLGGLSVNQFLELLQQLEQLIDQANTEGAGTGTSESFREDRTITEVTGLRLVSLLTSMDVRLGQLVGQGGEVVSLLRALALPSTGLTPPAVPATGSTGAGGVQVLGPVSVYLELTLTGIETNDPKRLGALVGTIALDQIDRGLHDTANRRAYVAGALEGVRR